MISNLRICREQVQLFMARRCMNPYNLCSKAGISYPAYRKIMETGKCKLATLGKIATALEVDVSEIIEVEVI